ncbi:hypothetical protein [Georgenia wangjunii]|uniref:hypothetical protein n=1 Tax=Georgenia wangjunii TaxID=3117730 RepID=UPI002F26726E
MTWFLVWTLLALAALATLALLGWGLWRRAVALGKELAAAGRLAERLSDVGGPASFAPVVPGVTGDPVTLAQARAERGRVGVLRRTRRATRAAAALARWRAVGLG